MYVASSACVKGGESEPSRIDSRGRQGCVMSSWLFDIYMDRMTKEVKMWRGRRGVRFQEDGRKWILPGLLYAYDWVLCGESEEDLRAIVGRFDEVCRRKAPKVDASKSKVMVLNGEDELVCEAHVDGI